MFVIVTYLPLNNNRVTKYELVNTVPDTLVTNQVTIELNPTNIPPGFYESFNQYQVVQNGTVYTVSLISGETESKREIAATTESLIADQAIAEILAQAILDLPWTVVRSNQVIGFAVL